ncbi:type II toxin-antitoxin system HicA family toxin [Candidatus Poribacteria bacterium]|nr:type II toxin-antitoxin system HicA family toxin [Candidatus Poribacteria bacterium]
MKSSDVIKILKKDGWFIHNIRGSHCQFKHSAKPGKVTVPHPKSDLPIETLKNIFHQARIEWRTKK